ncbi:hypothetical protein V7S43_009159 [Phytophthora oleae]|uniref:Pentacotripeptide-repeat region of PRORP domain-containing protein n=1 Tax=Phytophthora oleae TaxID=2107226 RepID=A0ABD3FJI3_9STRA
MLSARGHLQRSLLRSLPRQSRCISLPSPHTPSVQIVAPVRWFSQQNDASESLLKRLKTSLSDASYVARLVAQDLQDVDLTDDEAFTLLLSFAKQKRVDDCVGLLRYCQEQQVTADVSARVAAFRMLSNAGEFAQSLELFEGLTKSDEVELKPWMVGRALVAAKKLNRPESVTRICQLLAKNFVLQSGEGVMQLLKRMKDRGQVLDVFAINSIAIFADREGDVELALEVLELVKDGDEELATTVYPSVLEACGKAENWEELVKVYEEMPEKMRFKLYRNTRGLVVRAYVKQNLLQRGLDVFTKYDKQSWSTSMCNAALEALLKTWQFEELFALAEEMKEEKVKWDAITYKMVTQAYIEIGSADKAKKMLVAEGKSIDDCGAECYRELIAAARGDPQEVCQLYMEMLQSNLQLELSDWRQVLQLALELPGQTMYWRFRKLLQLCGKSLEANLPSRLLLVGREEQKVSLPDRIEEGVASEDASTGRRILALEASLARERFDRIKKGGVLTRNVASTLLTTMAKHHHVDDCVEMLDYFEKRGVQPKAGAVLAAYRVLGKAAAYATPPKVTELDQALRAFETLYKNTENCEMRPWVYAFAINAATQLNRQQTLSLIFQSLLAVGGTRTGDFTARGEDVHGMLNDARKSGVPISEFSLRALVSFADQTSNSDLALDVFYLMQDQGMEISTEVYGRVLAACGRNDQWRDVLGVFEDAPTSVWQELSGSALGSVLMAHVKSGDEDLVARGLALFDSHPSKWTGYACNAALEAFLQSDRWDELLTLADDMTRHCVKWSSFTCRSVVLAHTRSGSTYKARRLLRTHSKLLQNKSVPCYRDLIDYYVEVRGDVDEALQVCEEMMLNNWKIPPSDWGTALELALELPDRTTYWHFRKQLWLRGLAIDEHLPSLLLLPQRASPRRQGEGLSELLPTDLSLALEVFDDVQKADGSGLTVNVATKLLATVAKYNYIAECEEMLHYFKEQGVSPKPYARLAAFGMFCREEDYDQALEVFETVLQEDLALSGWVVSTALNAAMNLQRHELATRIIIAMQRNNQGISLKEYGDLATEFGEAEAWRSQLGLLSSLIRT